MSVCKSELQILGQKFSIDDYRIKRIEIKRYFKEKIIERLKMDGLKLHDLLMLQLRFTNRVNSVNLKRMIVGIQNEEAVYNKTSQMIRQETEYQTEILKNKAKLERETALLIGNNEKVRMETIETNAKLEFAILDNLSTNLKKLDFYNSNTRNNTKRIISFCWVTSLLYMKDNLNFYNNELQLSSAPLGFSPSLGLIATI